METCTDKQKMPNGGFKDKPVGVLNSQYKGGLVVDYVWMKKQCDLGLSLSDIAKLSNRSKRTVARWLEKHSLKTQQNLKTKRGKNHPNYKGNNICDCGNKKNHAAKTCINCRNFFGINNPNYKGIDDLMVNLRSRITESWRKDVFERDNYTCKLCEDNSGGNLEAHHIETLSSMVNRISKNVDFDFYELLDYLSNHNEIISIENGITLCETCHKEIHKGKRRKFYKL